jgi:hypothetical protein
VEVLDSKEDEMDRSCRVNEDKRKASRLLAGKPEGRGH